MLKRIKYCVFFLLISVVQVLGQDLYKLKVSIDTLIVTSNEIQTSECQTANFKAFHYEPAFRAIELDDISLTNDNPMPSLPPSLKPEKKNEKEESKKPNKEKEKIESNKPDKNNKKGKSKIEVRLKGDFNYLFYWSEDFIYSFVFHKIDTLNNHEKVQLPLVQSDSIFKRYPKYFYAKEVLNRHTAKNAKNKTILSIDSLRQLDNLSLQQNLENIRSGVYWMFPPNEDRNHPHFLIVDQNGTKLLVEPVEYWIHMNAFKASDFKKREYGQSLNYEDDIFDRLPLAKYANSNFFFLIAEGEGNKALTQSSKWKTLVDYNVFGNFKCMLPNTMIPSKNTFTTQKIEGIDYEKISTFFPFIDPNDSLNTIRTLHTHLGFVTFQLVQKIACTGIYRIHAPGAKVPTPVNSYGTKLEPTTVNNLKYLPGIYFLPCYFDVKTINGLSKEEFIKNQCKN